MSFWNNEYENELSLITEYIEQLEDKINNTENEMKNNPINKNLIRAWHSFHYLYRNNSENLNLFTPFNQFYLKEEARPSLRMLRTDKYIFLYYLLRVIYEYYFLNPDSDEFSQIWHNNTENIDELDKEIIGKGFNFKYNWIERSMPTSILRFLINSKEFASLREIAENINKYEERITEHTNKNIKRNEDTSNKLTTELNKLIQDTKTTKSDLDVYQKKLEEYKGEYNFVLLSKAFNNLHDKKSSELIKTKVLIWLFTTLLALPPAFSFVNHIRNWFPTGEGLTLLSFYLPLLTFEILIFYFMRLYYSESRALNTQLLQIDHRLSICEFIYDYFEKKNKSDDKDNKESWALFESLIFSPIQMTSDNIPSVLDGANAVAELAGKVMSKAKD